MPDVSFTIEVNGTPLSTDDARDVLQWIVDDSLHRPDTFAVWFHVLTDASAPTPAYLTVGAKVKISAAGASSSTPVALITGEITAVEGEYRHDKAPVLVARGYDPAHRLMRGRTSKLFRQMKYSDIARQVASDAGLDVGEVEDSGQVFEFVHQAGETGWDFLTGLAREIGFEVAVPDGKFTFGKPTPASDAPSAGDMNRASGPQLVFGNNLEEFRPRVTAGGQVKKVTVLGWDVSAKDTLTGQADAATTSVSLPASPGALADTFGSPEMVSGDRPHGSQPEVDAAAAAIAEQIASAFAEATGVAIGDPALKAGTAVAVSSVAPPFAGNYTLTHTRHVFELRHGYRTHFEISGRQERSLLGLASGGASGAASGGGGAGGMSLQIGIVDNIDDPDTMGRVRVKLPYAGPDFVTDWARVVTHGAGNARGMVFIPEVGDEVLVGFQGGDVGFPMVLGSLWNGQDAPPPITLAEGKLQARSIVSRKGHKVTLNDDDSNLSVEVASGDGNFSILIDQTNKVIKVNAGSSGKIVLSAEGDIELSSSQGKVTISGQAGAEISSQAQTKVSGNAGLNLESSGMTAVKGSQVSLG